MRLLVLVVVMVISTFGTSLAAGVGMLEVYGGGGDIRQEVGAFRHEIEWGSDNVDVPDGTLTQNAAYLQVEYALDQQWAAYVRVGAADMLMENIAPIAYTEVGRDFEGGVQGWGGLGIKGFLLGSGRPIGLGLFAEGRYFGPYEDEKTIYRIGNPAHLTLKLNNYWAGQVGLPVQLRLPGVAFYVGPHLAASGAKLELRETGLGAIDRTFATFREDPSVGVVAGAALSLGGTARLSFDGRFGEGKSWGVLLNFAQFVY